MSKFNISAATGSLRQAHLKWIYPNKMIFPQALRDAIPGPELPGCDRALVLAAIDGANLDTPAGPFVRLNFRLEETGKLTGVFDVHADLNLDAARALASTLQQLIDRGSPVTPPNTK